jgi:hypothetical protein
MISQYIKSYLLIQSPFYYLYPRQPSTSSLCWFKFWVLWQGNVCQWRSEDVRVVDIPHLKCSRKPLPWNPAEFRANLKNITGSVFFTLISPLLSPIVSMEHDDKQIYSIEYKLIDFTCIRFNQSISFTHNILRVVGSRILYDCYTRI